MKKYFDMPLFIIPAMLVALTLFSAGCETEPETTVADWAGDTLKNMTEEQRVGQLFCLTVDPIKYFLYPQYARTTNRLIAKYKPGAIFFPANIDTVKMEIRVEFNGNKLHDEIINLQYLTDIPFFIAANFESGAWHWDITATRFPYPLALGATQSEEFAYRQGKITSVEAKSQGITWIFSPIMNVSENPKDSSLMLHSLGNNYPVVSRLGSQYITGCQEVGIAGCMKFFPSEIPNSVMTTRPGDLSEERIQVLRAAVDAGVLSIMGPPLSVAEMDTSLAGNTAGELISGLLRDELGFEGIFISEFLPTNIIDNAQMEMDTVLNMLEAGQTMFILPEYDGTTDIPFLDLMMEETIAGNVDMRLINRAVKKIIETKYDLEIHKVKREESLRSMAGIGLPEYYRNSQDISDDCITLIKNDHDILPVDPARKYIVSIAFLDEFSYHYSSIFGDKIKEVSKSIKHINVFGIPDERIQREALRRAKDADILLCSFFIMPDDDSSGLTPQVAELMERIGKINDNIVAVSYYDPYLINRIPDVQAYLIPYSPSEHSMEATLEVIFGKRDALGRLPIEISEKYPIGFGLSLRGKGNGE